jgi:hypothetical protein
VLHFITREKSRKTPFKSHGFLMWVWLLCGIVRKNLDMTVEENRKRLKEKNALLDENEMINGKKACDYYTRHPV